MLATRTGAILTGRGGVIANPRIAPPKFNFGLTVHGDSLSIDQADNNYTWVLERTIKSSLGLVPRVTQRAIYGLSYNYAWGGAPVSGGPYAGTMISDGSIIDATIMPGVNNWLIVFAGTNGLSLAHNSVATEYANFKTYISARIAGGWVASRILVVLMLPRTGTNYVTQVTAFNTSVLGDDAALGYVKIRSDQNANIGASGQDLNTTYFYDGTHLTVTGQSILAGIISGAVAFS